MTNSKKWLAFGFLALAQLMIVLDATIVNVALPSIKSELGLSIESLQWGLAGNWTVKRRGAVLNEANGKVVYRMDGSAGVFTRT